MRHALVVVALASLALSGKVAFAQPANHLKCYRVKDPLTKSTYTADLGGLTAEPGCLIKVPARFTCVPATKSNVSPTPPGGGPAGTPNGFNCYVVKCPKTTLPDLPTQDQFGARTVTPRAAKMLCAPFAAPTTSTTVTTSTTSTTVATCANGLIGCGDPCAGTCTCMGPGTTQFCTGIHCGSFDQACVNTTTFGNECSFDGACPPGFACVAPTPATCAATVGGPGHCYPICPE